MTLTGTQQRPRPRYSTTARPLMKFYIILSFYIIVQPHTLWRSFLAVKDDDVRDDDRALYSPFIGHSAYFQKDED